MLVATTNEEIGKRIEWLWRRADWRTAKDLAKEMGETTDVEGIFTKLHRGKSISPQRLTAIAQLCAGRGNVTDNVDTVLGFLHGIKEEADVLRPRVRLVKEANQPTPLRGRDSNPQPSG